MEVPSDFHSIHQQIIDDIHNIGTDLPTEVRTSYILSTYFLEVLPTKLLLLEKAQVGTVLHKW